MPEYRVIGPPGTGKTTNLARRCQEFAREYGGDNILICSLTRSAASVIANKEIGGARIPVPKQNIATLHSFAYHALGEPNLADTPKGIKLWNEWAGEHGQSLYRLTRDGADMDDSATEAASGETVGDAAYDEYCITRARLLDPRSMSLAAQGFYKLWESFKEELDLMDFAELIDRAYAHVDQAPHNPKVILLDEAQDTPLAGMRLIRKWGDKSERFIVTGDPLQCLYFWAGSDPEAFTNPRLPSDRQEVLSQSYRVPRQVQSLALRWIEPHKREIEAQLGAEIAYRPRLTRLGDQEDGSPAWGDPVEGKVRALPTATYKWPETAVRDAEEQIAAGREVMFIAACSYMLQPLIGLLRRNGLPYHNPHRLRRGDWNPLGGSGRGQTASQRLLNFLRMDERIWPADDGALLWSPKEMWSWVEIMESKGVLKHGAKEKIKAIRDKTYFDDRGLPIRGEVTPADLDEWFTNGATQAIDLIESISHPDEPETYGDPLKWWLERLLTDRKRSMEFPVNVMKRWGPAKLKEKPMVTIGTIHSLKGSEASVVYVWPDLSGAGAAEWHSPGPGHDGVLRAFYVAFTRASEELVLMQRSSPGAVTWPSLQGL